MFDRPGVFYSMDPMTVFDNNWVIDSNKINNLKKHQLSIVNLSSEHYGVDGIDHVYHALESSGINFLLLSHEPTDHQKFNRMLFYPHWYHWAIKNFIGIISDHSNNRTHKWSCLNANPRAHRIYNYFYSKQQSYFDSAYFTFHYEDVSSPDDVILPSETLNFWESIKNNLPLRKQEISKGHSGDKRCDLPANTDAYIHLVTETTVMSRVFVTEKTWKPVASGQIFLVFGNPGTIHYLRNQGVDVFDDLIDHSYDLIDNWQDRLHAIHFQLKHLLCQDLQAIYIATQHRRTNNADKFLSGAFDPQYKQTIIECINSLN